ncbi:MAG: hypothetical protein KIS87_08190 [Phycisphaeraceae bacterium]|nr:hypothetical protein [Phycisphaeraceae bacterium]
MPAAVLALVLLYYDARTYSPMELSSADGFGQPRGGVHSWALSSNSVEHRPIAWVVEERPGVHRLVPYCEPVDDTRLVGSAALLIEHGGWGWPHRRTEGRCYSFHVFDRAQRPVSLDLVRLRGMCADYARTQQDLAPFVPLFEGNDAKIVERVPFARLRTAASVTLMPLALLAAVRLVVAACVVSARAWRAYQASALHEAMTRVYEGKTAYRNRRGLCVHCGYDLAGLPSSICPECGEVVVGVRDNGPRA